MLTSVARALNTTVTVTGQAVTATLTASRRAMVRAGRASREILREQVRLPTVVLMLVCVIVGIPVTVLLTPDQELTVVGQHLSVGARTPSLSISGPAQLVQIGNTQLDIEPLEVYGPLRPRLTLGPVQRNAAAAAALDPDTNATVLDNAVRTIAEGFLHWYLWATLILIGFALAATGIAASIRMLITLRRESRNHREPMSAAELWHRSTGQIRGMAVGAVLVSLLAWGVCGALAYQGAVSGLREVNSLPQLVGRYYLSPSPVGPAIEGYRGAVIGDSRASRLGGPLVPEPTAEDEICLRSTDSLAAEIGRQLQEPVLNLACPGASVTSGLRGPQVQSDVTLPPQVGVLKQVEDLRFVVVVIGPNDLAWVDQLLYCYAVEDCQDALTAGEFEYRLAAFDRAYGDLLRDLNDLPGSPQVIIVTSYDVFDPERFDSEAGCPDAIGPPGSRGLSRENVELLADRNQQLNDVLVTGAEKYGFTVANPVLTPLCVETNEQVGPDLQGLADAHPFHPTAVGMIRMAAAVSRVIAPEATE
ncbi:MAG TPA: GDSL-type esterase/lipase family protein [Micromonosporaceae bacterium]|nr:GDSL-type esterase/lipase family protein [Micromonosporaceae bacterium]